MVYREVIIGLTSGRVGVGVYVGVYVCVVTTLLMNKLFYAREEAIFFPLSLSLELSAIFTFNRTRHKNHSFYMNNLMNKLFYAREEAIEKRYFSPAIFTLSRMKRVMQPKFPIREEVGTIECLSVKKPTWT